MYQPGDLERRHGPVRRSEPLARADQAGEFPDTIVNALGKLSEALEAVEQARGHLYAFHRLSGRADRQLQEAVDSLKEGGQTALAEDIEATLVGRDVLQGMWTFQIVESYDHQYWKVFRDVEETARQALVDSQRHLYEARMKADEQHRDE